jgi:MraZ protein
MKFRGQHEYTIDPKGRVSLPSRLRDLLQESGQESFVITNYDNCVCGYSMEEWEEIEEKYRKDLDNDPDIDRLMRFVIGGAVEVAPDKQGRILIPPHLREYAGLEKDILLMGFVKRFEIWSRDRWQKEFGSSEKIKHEKPELARIIRSYGI